MAQAISGIDMAKRTPKLFAQSYKGYVEIVEAHKPPRPLASVMRIKSRLSWYPYSVRTRKMTVVSFEGTYNVVKSLPRLKFGMRTGHYLQVGTVWQLPKELTEKVLG
jgi:hypothetical protein